VNAAAGADPILQAQILRFPMLDPNLSCSVQAMRLPSYRIGGYNQLSAREIPGLWLAAVLGLTEVVEVMTTQDGSLDIKTTLGETALHGAASNGHYAMVQLLPERGAEVGASDNSGGTALHGAASNGYDATGQLLLDRGAEIGAKNRDGRTALYGAALNGHGVIVQLLLKRGAEVDVKDENGWTAPH
jgi:ankyrin repeat protein